MATNRAQNAVGYSKASTSSTASMHHLQVLTSGGNACAHRGAGSRLWLSALGSGFRLSGLTWALGFQSPSREPKAESRKPKAESRKPKAESPKPKAGKRADWGG